MMPETLVYRIAHQFDIDGEFKAAIPYGSGHINDTYKLTVSREGELEHYIVQRINHEVFHDCIGLMDNVERVLAHLNNGLRLIPARDGKIYLQDGENFWRIYWYITDTYTVDKATKPQDAYEVARTFGVFHERLSSFEGPRLNDTIPDFHNTAYRYRNLQHAIAADTFNRAEKVKDLIAYAEKFETDTHVVVDLMNKRELPERITHNDTKINNVLLDRKTGKGICVIDLDTVMPGSILYDFGDFVRSATSLGDEDDQNLDRVGVQPELFEALVKGFLSEAHDFLEEKEVELLPFSGRLIAYEIGIRFLTDYLEGDAYFKIAHEGHNIERCRAQFKMVESVLEQEDEMGRVIQRVLQDLR
jgi:Ser/Thr protein kinase RdoA (MazF antagonist)